MLLRRNKQQYDLSTRSSFTEVLLEKFQTPGVQARFQKRIEKHLIDDAVPRPDRIFNQFSLEDLLDKQTQKYLMRELRQILFKPADLKKIAQGKASYEITETMQIQFDNWVNQIIEIALEDLLKDGYLKKELIECLGLDILSQDSRCPQIDDLVVTTWIVNSYISSLIGPMMKDAIDRLAIDADRSQALKRLKKPVITHLTPEMVSEMGLVILYFTNQANKKLLGAAVNELGEVVANDGSHLKHRLNEQRSRIKRSLAREVIAWLIREKEIIEELDDKILGYMARASWDPVHSIEDMLAFIHKQEGLREGLVRTLSKYAEFNSLSRMKGLEESKRHARSASDELNSGSELSRERDSISSGELGSLSESELNRERGSVSSGELDLLDSLASRETTTVSLVLGEQAAEEKSPLQSRLSDSHSHSSGEVSSQSESVSESASPTKRQEDHSPSVVSSDGEGSPGIGNFSFSPRSVTASDSYKIMAEFKLQEQKMGGTTHRVQMPSLELDTRADSTMISVHQRLRRREAQSSLEVKIEAKTVAVRAEKRAHHPVSSREQEKRPQVENKKAAKSVAPKTSHHHKQRNKLFQLRDYIIEAAEKLEKRLGTVHKSI